MAIHIDAETQKKSEKLHATMPEPRPSLEDVDTAVAADGIEYYEKMPPEQAKLSIMTRASLMERKSA